jgi:hypothetical protein
MLQSAIQSVCSRAGWKEPPADGNGFYAFHLEGGLSFTLSSPDGERLLARSTLLAPEAGGDIAGETLAAIMRITAARFARLKAVTALNPETGELELYAFTGLRGNEAGARETFVEDFLNELSFWKAQSVQSASTAFIASG